MRSPLATHSGMLHFSHATWPCSCLWGFTSSWEISLHLLKLKHDHIQLPIVLNMGCLREVLTQIIWYARVSITIMGEFVIVAISFKSMVWMILIVNIKMNIGMMHPYIRLGVQLCFSCQAIVGFSSRQWILVHCFWRNTQSNGLYASSCKTLIEMCFKVILVGWIW